MKNFRSDLADKLSLRQLNTMSVIGFVCCMALETMIFTTLFSVFVETIKVANSAYLSDLPIIGALFSATPEASASHLISALMALFCVATPIWLWSWVIDQKIMDNPQGWISFPQHKFYAAFAVILVLLVLGIEAMNIFTLISQETAQNGGYVQTTEDADLKKWLAENKGMAVAASLVLTLVNFILALISVKSFHALKSEE